MAQPPPNGITPPAPGLDREEPDLAAEDDIPSDDEPAAGDGPSAEPERE